MAVIEDAKALPKDEPKLQKYCIYCLLVCLAVSVCMTIWYVIRMNSRDGDISTFWSVIHVCAYIALSVVTGLGIFGAYYPKPQFLSWFITGIISIIVAEVVCVLYNQLIVENKFGIIVLIIKIFAIIVFIASAVLACLWKRLLDKTPTQSSESGPKAEKGANVQKDGTKAEEKPKNDSKSKAEEKPKTESKPKA